MALPAGAFDLSNSRQTTWIRRIWRALPTQATAVLGDYITGICKYRRRAVQWFRSKGSLARHSI
jgi:hypothetical protein